MREDDLQTLLSLCAGADFENPDSVKATGHLLVSLLQINGGFSCQTDKAAGMRKIIIVCKDWIYSVEQNISVMPAHGLIGVAGFYDLVHRAVYHRPATDFVNSQFQRVFDARIHGDRLVDETELMMMIHQGLVRRDRLYLDKPLYWSSATLSEWYRECETTCSFRDTPLSEALKRVAVILNKDLSAYNPSPRLFKERLAGKYLPCIENAGIDCDAESLSAMLLFIRAVEFNLGINETLDGCESRLLDRLSCAYELDRAEREAFAIDFGYKKEEKIIN